jgi:heme exporter protein C
MVLTYAAYLMLRAGIEDPTRKRGFMSVYGIFAFVSVLTTLFIIRIVPATIHPVIVGASPQNAQGTFEATSGVFMALGPSLLLWLILMPMTFMWHRYRLENRIEAVNRLKIQLLSE